MRKTRLSFEAIERGLHDEDCEGQKCRASKAVILGVDGTTFGENVGISKHDGVTEYWAGDTVEIDDFDLSGAECSTGFHFFCTRAEAEAY